jgi:hypothetical protein
VLLAKAKNGAALKSLGTTSRTDTLAEPIDRGFGTALAARNVQRRCASLCSLSNSPSPCLGPLSVVIPDDSKVTLYVLAIIGAALLDLSRISVDRLKVIEQ